MIEDLFAAYETNALAHQDLRQTPEWRSAQRRLEGV